MVYASLFEKLFEIDLAAPDVPARWWFIDGWVDHALTNEEILFNWATQPLSKQLAEAVETFSWIAAAA
ncbi:MAG TPA: hypothetical protein VMR89_10290 [Actinomycetota bacterium]|nr:hypothetical protein [Actinomycetota bacterium]